MKSKFEETMKHMMEEEVPDVLSSIKSDPRFHVPEKKSGFSLQFLYNKKIFAGVLSIFILTLVLITSINSFSEPVVASTVTIDINPSIVITLDENDYVINVTSLNDDGDEIVSKDIKYTGLTIDEVVTILVERLEESNYIVTSGDDYNIVLINVENSDSTKKEMLKELFSNKFNEKLSDKNAEFWVLDSDKIHVNDSEVNTFKENQQFINGSNAKFALIYRLTQIQDEYTVNELSMMSIRELYAIYIEYENQEYLPNYDEMPKARK